MIQRSVDPIHILLVDDERDLRCALGEFLEMAGFRVTTCGSCREALAAINLDARPFQIILSDLKLPDGEGLDIVKAAKTRWPGVLAAVMTGYASLETAMQAIRVGAYDYIAKPFSLDQIEILVRNMGDKVRLMEKNQKAEEQLREIYLKMELLQGERIEFMRLSRDIKREFQRVSLRLDKMEELLTARVQAVPNSWC